MDRGACTSPSIPRDSDDRLRVRDVMIPRPKTLPGASTVADVRRQFTDEHVRIALLADGSRFVGALTREVLASGVPDETPARDITSADLDTIGPDAPVAEALRRLESTDELRLVVLDDDGRTLRGLLCLTRDHAGFCQGTRSRPSET